MVRVLAVSNSLNPVSGGIETFLMNIFENIDGNIIHMDFVVHSQQPQYIIDYITSKGSRVFQISPYNVYEYRKFWKKLLKEHHDYDFVHVHSYDPAFLYLSIAKKFGIKTIVHSHTTNVPHFDLIDRICRFNQFLSHYFADYFFGCSFQAIYDRFGEKVANSNKSITIPNGIDTEKFRFNSEQREKIRKELSINSDTVVIGQVGRLCYQKNQLFSLDVFYEFNLKKPNSVLMLIGKGSDEEKIREKIKKLKLEAKVMLLGEKNNIADYLSAFDCFLFPSIYEGLGIALVEAQCSGLPCLVSDVIVPECDMGSNLLFKLSLKNNSKTWAYTLLKKLGSPFDRNNSYKSVYSHGYDIKESTKVIQNIYVLLKQEGL